MILNTLVLVPAMDFSHDLKKAKFFLSHLHRLVEAESSCKRKERLISEASALIERLIEKLESEAFKEEEHGKAKFS